MSIAHYLFGPVAILQGLKLVVTDCEIRKLAVWPFAISALVYLFAVTGAYFAHGWILQKVAAEPAGFLDHFWYYLAWIGVFLGLLVGTMVVSFAVIKVLSGPFQSYIAQTLLRRAGIAVKEDIGISGAAKGVARTVLVETKKLLCFSPLILAALVLSLIPVTAPIGLVMSAWLLAYQFIDVPLDLLRVSVRRRVAFSLRIMPKLIGFGTTLAVIFAVPFAGILLAPAAAAGVTWLLIETRLIDEFSCREATSS